MADYQRDAVPLRQALADAGIDPTDFGRFVNRPVPGVLRPSTFDGPRAVAVLLEWLPRVANESVKESMVRHLRIKAAKGVAVGALVEEFERSENPNYKWVIADVLQYVCTKDHYSRLVELAADPRHGMGRAPLMDVLWRVKTERADHIMIEALSDPDTARWAMSALRRRLGNAATRPLIEPLLDHPHPHISQAAKDYLRRIDKYLLSHDA